MSAKETISIETPIGVISATTDPQHDYPGIWLELNGEGLVLLEFDRDEQHFAVRVWNEEDVSNDPVYVRKFKSIKEEE